MSLPVTSALSRRDRLWPAVGMSALLHAALVAWAVARRPPPALDLDQKPIVAKLVRLGEKRPEEWLPRKEAAPPPPAAPRVAAAPPAAVAAPRTPAPSPAAKPAPPAAGAPAPAEAPRTGASLSSILSKVQRDVDEKRWGDADGDPDGDSETAEGDQYLALIDRAIHAHYRVPSTISDKERLYLEVKIVLWIEPDGHLRNWKLERPSGNSTFDSAVERALQATKRVPPPPDYLRDTYRRIGLPILFQAR